MTRVTIVHHTDLWGPSTGGIDAFIRGYIDELPGSCSLRVIGATADVVQRPVGVERTLLYHGRSICFLPVAKQSEPMQRTRIPNTVRMLAGLLRHRAKYDFTQDWVDFHRIEYSLVTPKALVTRIFLHQDMRKALSSPNSDIKWKFLPQAYFFFERIAANRADSVLCVTREGAEAIRKYTGLSSKKVGVFKTWADETVFNDKDSQAKARLRSALREELQISPDAKLVLSVGRLDSQKDPLRLLNAFATLQRTVSNSHLVYIGTGPLRDDLDRECERLGITEFVSFLGLQPSARIAVWLHACDVFALSSRYEGMPISVLEALQCGARIVATRVGEVGDMVPPGAGFLAAPDASPNEIAALLEKALFAESQEGAFSIPTRSEIIRDLLPYAC